MQSHMWYYNIQIPNENKCLFYHYTLFFMFAEKNVWILLQCFFFRSFCASLCISSIFLITLFLSFVLANKGVSSTIRNNFTCIPKLFLRSSAKFEKTRNPVEFQQKAETEKTSIKSKGIGISARACSDIRELFSELVTAIPMYFQYIIN